MEMAESEANKKVPEIRFIQSQRGAKLLVANNFIYRTHHTQFKDSIHWRCITNVSCSGRMVTDKHGVFVRFTGEHCHATQSNVIQKKLFVRRCRERSTHEPIPISKIYKEEVEAVTVAGEIPFFVPSLSSIGKILYRARSGSRVTMVQNYSNLGKTFDKEGYLVLDKDDLLDAPTQPFSDDRNKKTGLEKTDVPHLKKFNKQKLCDEQTENKSTEFSNSNSMSSAERQDKFHELGMTIAKKLRTMDPEQQMFAENIIGKVLSFGNLGQLTSESDFNPIQQLERR